MPSATPSGKPARWWSHASSGLRWAWRVSKRRRGPGVSKGVRCGPRAGMPAGDGRLAGDRQQQLQVVLPELLVARLRVHLDDAERLAGAAHGQRRAHDGADAAVGDALAQVEALVRAGVFAEDRLAGLQA